jgi:hypothetical protein
MKQYRHDVAGHKVVRVAFIRSTSIPSRRMSASLTDGEEAMS